MTRGHHGNCRCAVCRVPRMPAEPLVALSRRNLIDRYVPQSHPFAIKGRGREETQQPAGPKYLAQLYADRFDVKPKSAERLFSRLLSTKGQKWVTLDVADRICVLFGTGLEEVYGPYDEEESA